MVIAKSNIFRGWVMLYFFSNVWVVVLLVIAKCNIFRGWALLYFLVMFGLLLYFW